MISIEIKNMIPKICEYFSTQPIEKAWLFGSCSRGEETQNSDIDILVEYKKGARISLFVIAKISIDLENILSRSVDLIEKGCLLPFAVESAEHDKILIYERAA
ncbi:MAG: nucleotidyltransferase domain-containing protein [Bacteroidales bacterium]|nr:nucleotidyltransferase domain-containing protein [Bacteroidales bacterium]